MYQHPDAVTGAVHGPGLPRVHSCWRWCVHAAGPTPLRVRKPKLALGQGPAGGAAQPHSCHHPGGNRGSNQRPRVSVWLVGPRPRRVRNGVQGRCCPPPHSGAYHVGVQPPCVPHAVKGIPHAVPSLYRGKQALIRQARGRPHPKRPSSCRRKPGGADVEPQGGVPGGVGPHSRDPSRVQGPPRSNGEGVVQPRKQSRQRCQRRAWHSGSGAGSWGHSNATNGARSPRTPPQGVKPSRWVCHFCACACSGASCNYCRHNVTSSGKLNRVNCVTLAGPPAGVPAK